MFLFVDVQHLTHIKENLTIVAKNLLDCGSLNKVYCFYSFAKKKKFFSFKSFYIVFQQFQIRNVHKYPTFGKFANLSFHQIIKFCLQKSIFAKFLISYLTKIQNFFLFPLTWTFKRKILKDIIFISTSHHLVTATIRQIFFKFLIFYNFWNKNKLTAKSGKWGKHLYNKLCDN